VGGGAESVRNFILNKYGFQYVIRSGVEVAFSESALYRDYLAVFRKGVPSKQLVVVILKKKIDELRNKIEDIAIKIKGFTSSLDHKISLDEFDAIKFFNADKLIERHISNLKPLVGFNTVQAQILALELLDKIKKLPTIADLQMAEMIELRLYRPGQYKIKGVESYAEKLFSSRYSARSLNVVFLIEGIKEDAVRLRLKRRLSTYFDLPLDATIRSLRTYSGIRHMNLTNDEEFAIIDVRAIPEYISRLTGLVPLQKLLQAAEDIKTAYGDLAANVLIARRIQLTSPGAYWLAFYSDNKFLGSQLPGIKVKSKAHSKLLTLYLNSTVCLLQLFSFIAESRGPGLV
jgi:hypothetical protein